MVVSCALVGEGGKEGAGDGGDACSGLYGRPRMEHALRRRSLPGSLKSYRRHPASQARTCACALPKHSPCQKRRRGPPKRPLPRAPAVAAAASVDHDARPAIAHVDPTAVSRIPNIRFADIRLRLCTYTAAAERQGRGRRFALAGTDMNGMHGRRGRRRATNICIHVEHALLVRWVELVSVKRTRGAANVPPPA